MSTSWQLLQNGDGANNVPFTASALLRLLLLRRSWLLPFAEVVTVEGPVSAGSVVGKCITTCRVFCIALSPSVSSVSQPCRHREPVRLPFWLLATFFDGLAPSASVVRCPRGSTKRFSTTSCVCSTRRFRCALNSLPPSLQRVLLALSSLLDPSLQLVLPLLAALLAPPA